MVVLLNQLSTVRKPSIEKKQLNYILLQVIIVEK